MALQQQSYLVINQSISQISGDCHQANNKSISAKNHSVLSYIVQFKHSIGKVIKSHHDPLAMAAALSSAVAIQATFCFQGVASLTFSTSFFLGAAFFFVVVFFFFVVPFILRLTSFIGVTAPSPSLVDTLSSSLLSSLWVK